MEILNEIYELSAQDKPYLVSQKLYEIFQLLIQNQDLSIIENLFISLDYEKLHPECFMDLFPQYVNPSILIHIKIFLFSNHLYEPLLQAMTKHLNQLKQIEIKINNFSYVET